MTGVALVIALVGLRCCALAQESVPGSPRVGGRVSAGSLERTTDTYTVRIDSFQNLLWQPEDNYFQSPGPVRIELHSLRLGETMVLTADDAEGRPEGDIMVRGRFRLVRGDAVLSGRELVLNTVSETGSLVDADAVIGTMRLRGARLVMAPEGALVATGASFTTCERDVPDYRIVARELRLSENGTVTARGVSLYIGRTPVLAIPWMQRNFRRTVDSPLPLPGYSKETGASFRLRNNAIASPGISLRYDVTASLRKSPFGNLEYEQDLGRVSKNTLPPNTRKAAMSDPFPSALEMHPTFPTAQRDLWDEDHRLVAYASVGAKEYVGHRLRTDLRLSRLPEVGLAGFRSGVRTNGEDAAGSAPRRHAAADRWGYHWDLSGGWYRELPAEASSRRVGLRAGVTSPGLSVANGLEVRLGLSVLGAAYEHSQSYGVLAPEVEAMWRAFQAVQLGVAFRLQRDSGSTPFVFDRADVRNEMRLYCQGGLTGWDYSLAVAYDTDRMRAYDTNVMVRRKLDCLEVGLSYRSRSQGLGLILNLLPGHVHGDGGK